MRKYSNGKSRYKICAGSPNELKDSEVNRSHDQDQHRPADDAAHITDNLGTLCSLRVRARLLIVGKLLELPGGKLAFGDLVLGYFNPIGVFAEGNAEADRDQNEYGHRCEPTW